MTDTPYPASGAPRRATGDSAHDPGDRPGSATAGVAEQSVTGGTGIGGGPAQPAATAGAQTRPVWHFARRPGPLAWLAVLIALLLSIPILTVAASLIGGPESDVWGHLAATVLPRYISNTLWLVIGVGLIVPTIGAGTAWLVTMCRFPGRRVFEWALILPLAVPAYVMAYTYTDFLQFTGPVQTALRDLMGWGPRAYWFPEIRSLWGAIAMLSFVLYPYVYLLARACFLEQSVCASR
jgi:iron(III) transport system permease protein